LLGLRALSALFPRIRTLIAVLAIASSSAPRAASAQVAGVVPPVPAAPLYVDYPAGAQGDATVILLVTVNADGSVRSARAEDDREPFAAAALAAAHGWRFTPATRDGAPIAATIKVAVEVRAPAPPDPPPGAATFSGAEIATAPAGLVAAPNAGLPPPPAPLLPVDITIRGEHVAPAASSLTRAEVRLLPGAFGDPFRAIESLPGVTPIGSGVPFFYVRGAPPGDTGYFLDGVRVPLLYHIGLGPSVIHPALVERVDLYPGGYPARYGRYVGGIVAGETKAPAEEARGEANIRLVDAGTMVETPFDEGRGSALIGGRYSYTGAILSLVSPSVRLDYWDYQSRVAYDVTSRDRVSALVFGAHDYLGHVDGGAVGTDFSATFHRADLRWDRRASERTKVRQAITLGLDRTQLEQHTELEDKMLAARVEVVHRVDDDTTVRAGADGTLDSYDVRFDASDFVSAARGLGASLPARRDVVVGSYVDVTFRPIRALELSPGLRADVFGSTGTAALGIDPRLASRLFVTDDVRLIQAFGMVHQPPSFVVPMPGIGVGGLRQGLQKGVQSSAGVEVSLPAEITASATFFRNVVFDLSDPLNGSRNFTEDYDEALSSRSLGDTIGMELYLRRRLTKRLGGFVSYTLSRSRRSSPLGDLPSMFDRTHVLNGALAYDLGAGIRAGSRAVFYTGGPTPPQVGRDVAGLSYPARFPSFFRLDVRLEKRWSVGKSGWISAVLEGQNVTLSKQVVGVYCTVDGCRYEWIGPVTIPSAGIEVGF
jgi:TonB family protein